MSNQPKITYRSDTTGKDYKMYLRGEVGVFEIIAESRNDSSATNWTGSPVYYCQFPWRLTINRFFDIVNNHINTGEWMP